MDSIFSYEMIKLLKQKSSDVTSKICTIQTIKNMRKDLTRHNPSRPIVLNLQVEKQQPRTWGKEYSKT